MQSKETASHKDAPIYGQEKWDRDEGTESHIIRKHEDEKAANLKISSTAYNVKLGVNWPSV